MPFEASAAERLAAGTNNNNNNSSSSNNCQLGDDTLTKEPDEREQRGAKTRSEWPNWCSKSASMKSNLSPLERFVTLLLPFILIFLLPTIVKLPPSEFSARNQHQLHHNNNNTNNIDDDHQLPSCSPAGHQLTHSLILALARLPIDRIRMQWGGLALLSEAKEVKKLAHGGDLLEEETHMMLLAPAEHRSGYAQAGGSGAVYQPTDSSGPGDQHGQTNPAVADYGGPEAGAPAESPAAGQGEPSAVAESVGGPHGAGALQTRSDLPAVRALNVKCEKNHMTVNIVFDRPFNGLVFSKGHYNDQKCIHLAPNSGQTSVNFDIHLGKCGMSSSGGGGGGGGRNSNGQSSALERQSSGQQPNGIFIENTIIIQYDPLVQEIYDQARKLRCTWYDYYEKSVNFRPYNVDMHDPVTANFLGDNIQCWMQIQTGKGPWSNEVAGIVRIGQTMTMVLAIKDDENRFDMLVRNCVAHDGKHQPIQLVDEFGCVARPKIMSKFQKVRNFGSSATVVSYAHFQAFKFPDSMNVHFQCVIQVCRYECPEPVCPASGSGGELGTSGAPSPAQADYAASGTELVASKELMPQQHPHGHNHHHHAPAFNSSVGPTHHSNAINLKLDESQGRVQVKLDTSMMAGLGNNGRPSVALDRATSGPLPPHLLYANYPEQVTRSTSFLRQPLAAASSGAASAGRSHFATPSASLLPTGNRVQTHDQQQQVLSFSPPFPLNQAARRSGFTSRLGDAALTTKNEPTAETIGDKLASAQLQHALDQLAPYEAEYPLSLIASPRGFKLNQAGGHLHRVKRDQKPEGANKRQARQLRSDSTSVQTHKSIQVVSPDDVAFSLLEPSQSDGPQTIEWNPSATSRRKFTSLELAASSSICFSSSRFLFTTLITLVALIGGVLLVTYVILKQRSQLEQKISAVQFSGGDHFQTPQGLTLNYSPTPVLSQAALTPPPVQHSNGYLSLQHQQQTICSDPTIKRQRDEMQQRNKYLARLYSQFSPSSYWRQ